MPDRPHVLVIGAGIIGASIAYHLAKSGARVTIVDASAPGGIATRHSWAWINASWGNPEPYFRLRIRAMADWQRLGQEVSDIRINWVGGLLWDLPPEALEAYAAQHIRWGYPIRRVDRLQAQRLEPALASPPDFALHVAIEGALDPLATAQALLKAAQNLGATLLADRAVLAMDVNAGRVTGVTTADGRLLADTVVVAAGAQTAALAATADVMVPMHAPPGLLVATKPLAKTLNGLVMAPDMHVRQLDDGRLLAGADFGGTDPGADAAATAQDVFQGLQRLLQGGPTFVFDRYQIGYRPMPMDGFPIVGPAKAGLYLAVTHSGITLAPIIGAAVAQEILSNLREPLLAPYCWTRFIA